MEYEKRRVSDGLEEDPDLRSSVLLIHSDLQKIKIVQEEQHETLKQVHELLQMFSNLKGFVRTIAVLSKIAMWLSLFAGGIGAVWLAWKQK